MSDPAGNPGSENSGEQVALITGITGQDGACLASLLLGKGYWVVGTSRKLAQSSQWRLDEGGIRGHSHLRVEELDLADALRCAEVISATRPAEVYNLGGLSFIGKSFAEPVNTARTTGLGAVNLLEAIRTTCAGARFFQASSSEMFGNAAASPQDEDTPFNPRSPYAAAKLFAHWSTVIYREAYGVFAASGILYNHESPLRGMEFVTRKITDAVARMSLGMQEVLVLGNLDARRDWGYAPDYAEAMWRTLQAGSPDTFILATGRLTSVRQFVEAAFRAVRVEIGWRGHGLGETGIDVMNGKLRVQVSPEFFRPAEAHSLCGRPGKAERLLGWKAAKKAEEICRIMVEADLNRLGPGEIQ